MCMDLFVSYQAIFLHSGDHTLSECWVHHLDPTPHVADFTGSTAFKSLLIPPETLGVTHKQAMQMLTFEYLD